MGVQVNRLSGQHATASAGRNALSGQHATSVRNCYCLLLALPPHTLAHCLLNNASQTSGTIQARSEGLLLSRSCEIGRGPGRAGPTTTQNWLPRTQNSATKFQPTGFSTD